LAPGCVVIAMIAGLVLAKAQQSKEAALISGDRDGGDTGSGGAANSYSASRS
jgi:hypothetical protein